MKLVLLPFSKILGKGSGDGSKIYNSITINYFHELILPVSWLIPSHPEHLESVGYDSHSD